MSNSGPKADEDSEPQARLRWLRCAARLAAPVFACAVLVALLLSFATPPIWWLDLFAHFQSQYTMALVLVGFIQLAVQPRWLAGAWLGLAAVSSLAVLPLYFGHVPEGTGDELRIVHCNAGGAALDEAALVNWLVGESPDLILLQEATPSNLASLQAALHRAGLSCEIPAVEARSDTRGVAMLSRWPGAAAQIIRVPADHDRPMIHATLDLSGVPLSILGFHATRPAPARAYRFQAEGLAGAQRWCQTQHIAGRQQVLIGDFNTTAGGALISELLAQSRLRDARRGHGINATWPAAFPAPLRVPIDGAYHSEGLVTTDMRVGPNVGSDHRPIIVTLMRRAPTN